MKALTLFSALGPVDLKNIRRDPMLMWMPILPLVPALLARWLVPHLALWLAADFDFDLTLYYPLLVSTLAFLAPSIAGVIIGFLLLDERDDHTLMALLVTPLSLNHYLAYRIVMPVGLGLIMAVVTVLVAGLVWIPLLELTAVALLAALFAPLVALFLASFAENKVVGFALMKSLNALLILPLIAYFVPSNWQLLAGLIPTYWPLKVYWIAAEGGDHFWLYFAVGLVVNLLFLAAFLRRFHTVVHR